MQLLTTGIGILLIVVGLGFAIAGVGSEQGTGGWREVGIKGPAWLILVAMGVGLIVFASTTDPAPNPPTTTSTAPATSTSEGGSTSSTETSSTTVPDTCVVGIGNPLATIREEPNPLAPDIVRVPAGSYEVQESALVEFAGRELRWLRITVDGRSGWIQDSTILIDSKTSACP